MKKETHKCVDCQKIIGVNIIPGNDEKDKIIEEIECIKCYNKKDWSEK